MLELTSMTTGVVAGVLMLIVIRGFIFMALRRDGTSVHYLSVGIVLVFMCAGVRSFYWDTLPQLMDGFFGEGTWRWWADTVTKHPPNILFNLCWIVGSLFMLKLLLQLIPLHERSRYNLLTAAVYPGRGFLWKIIDNLRSTDRNKL